MLIKTKTMFRAYILLVFVFGVLSVRASCDSLVSELIAPNQDDWSFSFKADIKKDKSQGPIVELMPQGFFGGGIKRTFKIAKAQDGVLVARALVKGKGLKTGKKPYQKAKLVSRYKNKKGKMIQRASHLDGTFDWGYVYTVLGGITGGGEVELGLRNEALEGTYSVKNIQLFLCQKSELGELDYPYAWADVLSDRQSGKVRLDYSHSTRWAVLRKELNGYNIGTGLNIKRTDQLLSRQEVAKLQPKLYRFPGGIRANFYHWRYDGFDPDDLQDFPVLDKSGTRKNYSRYSKGKLKFERDEFFDFVGNMNIPVSLVLNVLTSKEIEDQVEFVRAVQRSNGSVSYIELGNELYLKGQQGKVLAGAKDYKKRVFSLLHLLKNNMPDIPVGLPVSHHPSKWNKTLAGARLPFDAVITHPYVNVSSVATVMNDLALLNYAAHEVPVLFRTLSSSFPGKKIWVTEWNFEDRPYRRLSNGPIGVGFSANMLLSMLQNKDVEMAMFFSLFAPRLGLLSTDNKAPHNVEIKHQPLYRFWEIMGKLFSMMKETKIIGSDIVSSSNEYKKKISDLRAQGFKNKNNIYLLLVNNGLEELTVDIGVKDGLQIPVETWSLAKMTDKQAECSENCVVRNVVTGSELEMPPVSVMVVGPFKKDEIVAR